MTEKSGDGGATPDAAREPRKGVKERRGGRHRSRRNAKKETPIISAEAKSTASNHAFNASTGGAARFAAIDLGTNNCRLLIAVPRGRSFRVIDAFSRIVRLGEGLHQTGALSEDAMERTIEALKICAEKIERRGVNRMRCIATQACRGAANGEAFLTQIKAQTGLAFDIISTEEEARLAVDGCIDLMAPDAKGVVIFDIGGGSTEISVIKAREPNASQEENRKGDAKALRGVAPAAWFSMPIGVVSLSEKWGGGALTAEQYEAIVEEVRGQALALGGDGFWSMVAPSNGHLIGTSGTVTSIAGVHLQLPRYRREAVDGFWLSADEARSVSRRLLEMSLEERANEPCIGADRADLVVCGCAILEGVLRLWPAERIRVADRGLREGILASLAQKERKRRRRRRQRRQKAGSGNGAKPRSAPSE